MQFEHLRVGDVARLTGKTVRTLHYYEELGLLSPCQRSDGGYRLYGSDAVARVELIGQLKDLGFSLEQVRQILSTWEKAARDQDASVRLREALEKARAEARKKIGTFERLEAQIAESLRLLERGGPLERRPTFTERLLR